jgi:DNA-binding XRE family transcriptional regulator
MVRFIPKADLAVFARDVRRQASLTQKDVAIRLGVRQSSVSQAETASDTRMIELCLRIIREIGGYEIEPGFQLKLPSR